MKFFIKLWSLVKVHATIEKCQEFLNLNYFFQTEAAVTKNRTYGKIAGFG
jgi:hypothetical protein